jgi:hypothetical protein
VGKEFGFSHQFIRGSLGMVSLKERNRSLMRASFSDCDGTSLGDLPAFVEVGEAGIAMDYAMRRQRRVQLVG